MMMVMVTKIDIPNHHSVCTYSIILEFSVVFVGTTDEGWMADAVCRWWFEGHCNLHPSVYGSWSRLNDAKKEKFLLMKKFVNEKY